MQLGMWYWLVLFLLACGGIYWTYPAPDRIGRGVFLFLLVLLLGIVGVRLFGGPVQ